MLKKYILSFCILLTALGTDASNENPEGQQDSSLKVDLLFSASDYSKSVEVKIRKRSGNTYQLVEGVLCNLYLSSISRGGMMGSLITDKSGTVVFPLVNKFVEAKDTIDEYLFIVRIAADQHNSAQDDTFLIQKADLSLECLEQNDMRTVRVLAYRSDKRGMRSPIKNLPILISAQNDDKTFPLNPEPLLTDDNGEVLLKFDHNIKGDSSGYIKIIASIQSPEFGQINRSLAQAWGVPAAEWDQKFFNSDKGKFLLAILLLIAALVLIRRSRQRKA